MSLSDLTFEQARAAADHLRARSELESSRPAALVALGCALLVSTLHDGPRSGLWLGGMALGLMVAVWGLKRLLPRGNRLTYGLSLPALGLNAFLLGVLVQVELARWPLLDLPDVPLLKGVPTVAALGAALTSVFLSLPAWIRRWQHQGEVQRFLAQPEPPAHLGLIEAAVRELRRGQTTPASGGITFRTVPADPRNLRRFLRLDLTVHGSWRVLLHPRWALVIAADGSRAEAVPRGGLRLVTDDLTEPWTLCLIRWNAQFHEGRIAPDHARALLAWIGEHPSLRLEGSVS